MAKRLNNKFRENITNIEIHAKQTMGEIFVEDNVQEDIDRFAQLVVWEMYSPIIKGIDKACSLEVEFID